MESIDDDVDNTGFTQYAAAAGALLDGAKAARGITDDELANPVFCRLRFRQMAAELDAAHRLVAHMAKALAAQSAELDHLAPPPEIRHAMTVRTSGMHAIAMDVDGQDFVVVAPSGGFQDPDQAYRDIVQHYGRGSRR